ncbi:MAG TPA: ABC transporter permease [Candidatus Saccharimonadales bacterium]|nr:ABC transporter permease [Candidatus Saccharimonadales bacterium]
MGAYVLRRILISIPVLLGITLLGFTALSLAPGDPLLARTDPSILARMNPADLIARRHALGLDQPLPVQYLNWLAGVLQGKFGYSIATGHSIVDEVVPRIGPTLLLMGTALLITVLVGIPLGVISAVRQYSRIDYGLTGLSLGLAALPTFVLGLAGIYIFGVFVPILPTSGIATLGAPFSLQDRAAHLILPAAILGLANAAPLLRYTRSSMLEVLSSEYMTTARSKGLGPSIILVRHGLRNALLPIVTIVGLLLPEMVGGAVITEQIFSWPGMGSLAVRAAQDRDPALMMGVILVVATGVLVSNLLTDVAYAVVDPRVKLDRA